MPKYEYRMLNPQMLDAEQLERAINDWADKGFRFVSHLQGEGFRSILMEREIPADRTTDAPAPYEVTNEKEDPA